MRLLRNARIHTMDPFLPDASVIAVDKDRILAVGGDELLAEFAGKPGEDMGGRVILPGLIDAHIHLQQYALSQAMVNCEVDNREIILQRISERVRQIPVGEWVLGHGWNQNRWGGIWPCARDLDSVAPHNPVYLTAKSLHASWANSLAMKQAGISGPLSTGAAPGIQRDGEKSPTGIFLEAAMRLIEAVIPSPTPAALSLLLRDLIPGLWCLGLTGVHDFDGRTCFQALQLLHERGELGIRVVKSIPTELLAEAADLGLRSGFGDDFLRMGPVKLFADGALGPRTAAMFEAYVDEPQNRGILLLDSENIFELGCQAAESGISLAVHAIGDRAVHEVLEGLARLRGYERENGLPALRHRIEHVQTIRPEDAGRLADLGVIASMQPVHAPSDMPVADLALGARAAYSYAWRTQLQHGARLAFGSDAPVEDPDPFLGLHAAVTRQRLDGSPAPTGWYPEQKLTIAEALEAYTAGAAFAGRMENRVGRLSAGFLADLIVLDQDPLSCGPAALSAIRPMATMVAGEWVWQR